MLDTMQQIIPTDPTIACSLPTAASTFSHIESLYSYQRQKALKYKEYNKIIESYEKMAAVAKREGKPEAVKMCETIVQDLQWLLKQGILGKFPHKDKKWK